MQNNPQAQAIQAAMMSHINEHLGYAYRVEIEKQLGMALPAQTDELGEEAHMDPQMEAQLAPMLAQAAQQLLQGNQAQAAQQQAQQQAQDPMVQMQQQDLQLKEQELRRKAAKDLADAQHKDKQLKLEAAKAMMQNEANKGQQKGDILKTMAKLDADKSQNMIKTGVDVLKHMSNQQHQSGQQKNTHAHEHDKRILDILATPPQPEAKPTKGE